MGELDKILETIKKTNPNISKEELLEKLNRSSDVKAVIFLVINKNHC